MNESNLIPNSDRTPKERQELARKAGIASGKARRERKTLKEELLLLLSKGDTQQKISLAILQKAMNGDTKAFEVIRDTVGEKPIDKVENTITYESTLKEMIEEDEY
jgi:hypothetical protein